MMCPRTGSSAKGIRPASSREDGRFFAALRMTCYALAFSEMCRSRLRQYCHHEEADREAMGPRTSSSAKCICPTSNRVDGRFFDDAQNDSWVEYYSGNASDTQTPDMSSRGGAPPASDLSAGRPTKDLLRHRILPARFARDDTREAARPHACSE